MATKYNGWTNYETWAVALWIDNEDGSYRHWRTRAREELANETDGAPHLAKGREKRAAAQTLAEELKQEITEGAPDIEGIYADLLGAALSEVNWYEVAESRFEE